MADDHFAAAEARLRHGLAERREGALFAAHFPAQTYLPCLAALAGARGPSRGLRPPAKAKPVSLRLLSNVRHSRRKILWCRRGKRRPPGKAVSPTPDGPLCKNIPQRKGRRPAANVRGGMHAVAGASRIQGAPPLERPRPVQKLKSLRGSPLLRRTSSRNSISMRSKSISSTK